MKVVTVVGKKNSGKTSLTVKLIDALVKRGYNVGSIKHSHHQMQMDRENTDTWRHKEAGSELVAGIGATTYFNIRENFDLNRILFLMKAMKNLDYIVIEGFKQYNYPKIATSPDVVDKYTIKEVDSFTITSEEIEELVDLIEDKAYDIVDTLFYGNCGYNDGDSIAREIIKGNINVKDLDKVDVSLSIDGKNIGLNKFVNNFIKNTILGMIKTLNTDNYDVENLDKIELVIDNRTETPKPEFDYEDNKIQLLINNIEIPINKFVSKYLKDTLFGMINALNTEEYGIKAFKTLDIHVKDVDCNDMKNSTISLDINKINIKINEFVSNILKESIFGMIKSLKIEKFELDEINTIDIIMEN